MVAPTIIAELTHLFRVTRCLQPVRFESAPFSQPVTINAYLAPIRTIVRAQDRTPQPATVTLTPRAGNQWGDRMDGALRHCTSDHRTRRSRA